MWVMPNRTLATDNVGIQNCKVLEQVAEAIKRTQCSSFRQMFYVLGMHASFSPRTGGHATAHDQF